MENFNLDSDDPFKLRNKLRQIAEKSESGMIDLSRGDPIDPPSETADKAFAQFLGEAAGLLSKEDRTEDINLISSKLEDILDRNDFPSIQERDAIRGRGYGENVKGDDMPRAVISYYLNNVINPNGKVKAHPEDIILFAGASEAVSITFKVLYDNNHFGDNSPIGCISPVYGPYNEQFQGYQLAVYPIPTKPEDGFGLQSIIDSWASTVKDHSPKAVILVSPNNPTGAIYSKQELSNLAAKIKQFDECIVIEDLVYAEFSRPESFYPFYEELKDRTIVIGSLSKAYRATGLRFGYMFMPQASQEKISRIANGNIFDSITLLKSPDTKGAFSHTHHLSRPVQYMGALRLVDMMVDPKDLDSYIENLRFRWAKFQRILGMTPPKNFAPYYILLNFYDLLSPEKRESIGEPENLFAQLAQEKGVVLLPAHRFYLHQVKNSKWHARVSAANVNLEKMIDAAHRIKDFISSS